MVQETPLEKEIVGVAATFAPLETENKVMWTAGMRELRGDGPVGSAVVSVNMSSSVGSTRGSTESPSRQVAVAEKSNNTTVTRKEVRWRKT